MRRALERITLPDRVTGVAVQVDTVGAPAVRQGDLFDLGYASAEAAARKSRGRTSSILQSRCGGKGPQVSGASAAGVAAVVGGGGTFRWTWDVGSWECEADVPCPNTAVPCSSLCRAQFTVLTTKRRGFATYQSRYYRQRCSVSPQRIVSARTASPVTSLAPSAVARDITSAFAPTAHVVLLYRDALPRSVVPRGAGGIRDRDVGRTWELATHDPRPTSHVPCPDRTSRPSGMFFRRWCGLRARNLVARATPQQGYRRPGHSPTPAPIFGGIDAPGAAC